MNVDHPAQAAWLLIIATAAAAAAGCGRTDGASSTAQASTSANAEAPDRVVVDAPIAHRDIDLVFTAVGAPNYAPTKDTITYRINVANNGEAPIASTGRYPVNLGLVILGADGSLDSPPGKQDFVRIRLPRGLKSGENLTLEATFPVAPTLGGTVILDAVQERVAWFRGYNKPVLTLGSFIRCAENPGSTCMQSGVRIDPVAR